MSILHYVTRPAPHFTTFTFVNQVQKGEEKVKLAVKIPGRRVVRI